MGSKKSKTTSQQSYTGTSTSTPNVPDWLSDPYKVQAQTVGQLQGMDPTQFASKPSQLQSQAFAGAGDLSTSPLIGQAGQQASGINYTPSTVNGESLLSNLSSYYTPFKDQVMNPVLADLDVSAGKTRAAQAAQAASTGAFRGSRYGIREGETEGDLSRARATTEGGLLNQMYDTATSLSSQDAQRRQDASAANAANGLAANSQRLQGAGLLSSIGQAQGSEDRANLGAQATLGGTQQQLADSQRQAPLNYASALEGLLSGLNPSLFTGQTTDSSGQQQGTSTTKNSQSLGAYLGDLMMAFAGGGGKGMGASAGGG